MSFRVSKRWFGWLPVLVLLLAFALRVLKLGDQNVWWDEAFSVWVATPKRWAAHSRRSAWTISSPPCVWEKSTQDQAIWADTTELSVPAYRAILAVRDDCAYSQDVIVHTKVARPTARIE